MGDCVAQFLNDISQVKLLAENEQRELIKLAQKGDVEARNKVVTANLKLVHYFAKKLSCRGTSMEDLIQDGTLGLIHSVEKFDPNRGIRFSTYSGYWIFQSMSNGAAIAERTIRVPSHMVTLLRKANACENEMYIRTGKAPSASDVLSALGLDNRKASYAKSAMNSPTRSIEGIEPGFVEIDRVELKDDIEKMKASMSCLAERERRVIWLRFFHEPNLTLGSVGKMLSMSRERIRQIESEALGKMRAEMAGVENG